MSNVNILNTFFYKLIHISIYTSRNIYFNLNRYKLSIMFFFFCKLNLKLSNNSNIMKRRNFCITSIFDSENFTKLY